MAYNEKLDKILIEQKAKGENYADWQKKRYPVEASHKNSRNDVSIYVKENANGKDR